MPVKLPVAKPAQALCDADLHTSQKQEVETMNQCTNVSIQTKTVGILIIADCGAQQSQRPTISMQFYGAVHGYPVFIIDDIQSKFVIDPNNAAESAQNATDKRKLCSSDTIYPYIFSIK